MGMGTTWYCPSTDGLTDQEKIEIAHEKEMLDRYFQEEERNYELCKGIAKAFGYTS